MKIFHAQTIRQPAVFAKKLLKLERCGRYDEALEELADIWQDFDLEPDTRGLLPEDAAELVLRCGALLGFHGHVSQVQTAQLRSKDLLTNSRDRFLALNQIEKAAECEVYIVLALWRTREYNEAEIWIAESLTRDLPVSSDTRLYAHIAKSMIDRALDRHEEVLANLKALESDFLKFGSAFLTGSLYTNLALALKNLGKKLEAAGHFELARYYHQRSRHKSYLATVENNLAQIYKETGKFAKAHQSADNATRLFAQTGDKTREGFSLDTKALIYLAEARYKEALKSVDKALSILEKSENFGFTIETLLTKAKVLLNLDDFSAAVLSLFDAVSIAKVQTGEESAKRLIDEFELALNEARSPVSKENLVAGDFELILPPSIAHFPEYKGIWINSTGLEEIGVAKGSLAIVVPDTVGRGDLVAVSERETALVSCGFYDSDFGIVCLESPKGEPLIFNEDDVMVLGKIVGVCDSGKNEDGKMVVRSLKL